MPPARRDRRALVALLLVAGAPLPLPSAAARAEDPAPLASGGSLRLSAEPARLVLGRDLAADLRVAVPADVEDVTLSASVGRVDALRRVSGGYVARYRPPADRLPQVAIVAAFGRTARGAEHGWVAIPLSGQGDARVRTTPGQEITLQIGEERFGPGRAGPDGVAVIPVVVPPGVREAHHGFKPIDLHVPETPLLYAVAERGTVLADRPERVRVFAYVVAPHGAARRGEAPAFEPSRGSVSVVEREPGALEATWTLPPGHPGEERLLVRLQAGPASRNVVRVESVAGPPAVVAVSFDRDALVAGQAEPVTVTARALDAAGNPVAAAFALAADGGVLDDVRQAEPGAVQAHLHAGPDFGGREGLRVTAAVEGAGVSGARTLPLRPGAPAVARFEDASRVYRGDGARATLLRVRVTDAYGNPVAAVPAVSAERGQVLAVAAAGPGVFDVRYVAPAVVEATAERLRVNAGAARARAEPLLLGPAPGRALVPQLGALADLRGRFVGASAAVALELPADWPGALARGLETALRGDVVVTSVAQRAEVALLGGGTLSRAAAGAVLHASATAGLLLAPDGGAPAARLSAGATFRAGALAPFVEASLLGAGRGAPGAFAALGVGVGVRLNLEARHGDDPHRR